MNILLGKTKFEGEDEGDVYLMSDSRTYNLVFKTLKSERVLGYFTSLEYLFKSYLNLRIKNYDTTDFKEVIKVNNEALKEIKSVVKIMMELKEKWQNKHIRKDIV